MADGHKPDKAMAGMLKRKSVWPPACGEPGRTASPGEVCPDAATLAAYFDHSLSASETSQWELHFSVCLRCQEQLAALARSEPASVATPAVEKKPAISWLWDWRWMAPVGAAVVVLVFFVSYKTMYAPAGSPGGGELMAKREAASPAPAATEPKKQADSTSAKTDAVAETAPTSKPPSTQRQGKSRSELDAFQRKNAVAAAEAARIGQPLKDKSAPSVGTAAGVVAPRVLAKPADEEKQVAAAENRAIVEPPQTPAVYGAVQAQAAKTQDRVAEPSRAQAAPAQVVAPGVHGLQKQERVIAAADAKEPAAPAPPELQTKDQAAARKENAAGRQDTARARLALETAPKSKSNLFAAQGEFIVSVPNSKVLWRFGSAGRIERSRDAGKTWETQVARGLPPRWQESFLSGSAPSENICWAGGSNGVLLRTTDGGENWERIPAPTKGDIISVKASDQLNVTVIGADGRTYETRDAGTHWRAR